MNGASTALRTSVRWVGKAGFLLVLWGAWLGSLGVAGTLTYRRIFHFDAADWANWVEVQRQYLGGATIPFDFAATAAGLLALGLIGCVVLAMRFSRLSHHLFGLWPVGYISNFVSNGLSFSSFGPRRQTRRYGRRQEVKDGIHRLNGFVRIVLLLGQSIIRWGRSAKRKPAKLGVSGPSETLAIGTAVAVPPSADGPANGEITRSELRADTGSIVSALAAGRTRPEEPVATIADDSPASPTTPSDEDYAVFGRAMALFEVWSDPAPDWMQAALREELDTLSIAGFGLFASFGEPAMMLLDAVGASGLMPADPAKRAVVQTLLEHHRSQANPDDILTDEIQQTPFESTAEDGPPANPKGAACLTMSAAWLCEMVDNFVMLEEIRAAGDADSAPSFEDRWGAIYQETGERLKFAMQAMNDKDWHSIDQFPDRAGRIRVLTDRLREELRILPGRAASVVEAGTSLTAPAPPTAMIASPVATVSRPRPSAAATEDESVESQRATLLEAILRAAGYAVRTLPAIRGPAQGATTDYLAERDDFAVLLRLADLSGGDWAMDGDSLAPWRGGAGHVLPSPCRAVWQRLALLRSLDRAAKPWAGVVVLRDGHFTDEQAVARIVERDRCRTDVGLAWLDRPSSTLPDLTAWLVRMETVQSKFSVSNEDLRRIDCAES